MMLRLGYEIAASHRSSQRRLDCGNPRCGFARIRCPDCGEEHLLMFSCRHTGFHVHSRVRAKTKMEAERVGKYMIRSLLSLERLSLDEKEGPVRQCPPGEGQESEPGRFPSPDYGGGAPAYPG